MLNSHNSPLQLALNRGKSIAVNTVPVKASMTQRQDVVAKGAGNIEPMLQVIS